MKLGYEKTWDQSHKGYPDFCNMAFNSPVGNILNTYHHLALRAAIFAAVDLDITHEVRFFGHYTRRDWLANEWQQFLAFGIGFAIAILMPLCTVALGWGTWRLKGASTVTMNPVDIAKMMAPEFVRGKMDLEQRRGGLARLRRVDVASEEGQEQGGRTRFRWLRRFTSSASEQ